MSAYVIEDIEELRRREGIVDRELKSDIARLRPGQSVKLSFATGPSGFETLTVCLTSVREGVLRGRLVKKPKATALRSLDAGSLVTFRSSHVHSIVGRSNSAECISQSPPMPTRSELLREARMEADRECEPARSFVLTPSARLAARATARPSSAIRKSVPKNLRKSS